MTTEADPAEPDQAPGPAGADAGGAGSDRVVPTAAADAAPRRRRRVRLKTVAEVSTVLSLGVAAVALVVELFPERTGNPGGGGPTPVTSTPSPPVPPTSSSRLQVGDCLRDAGGASVVDCTSSHVFEVFALEDCDDDALVRYLGGQPGVENVRAAVRTVTVGADRACVVADAGERPTVTPVAGVLQTEAGSAWRRCVDARTSAEVPCSEHHTGELLPVLTGAAATSDCTRAAEQFMGTSIRNVAGRLQVVTLRQDVGQQCVISTLGQDLLHSTVRRLGSRSLPLVQD